MTVFLFFFLSGKHILITQFFTRLSCSEINIISGSLAESFENVNSMRKNLTLIFTTSIFITNSKQKNLTFFFHIFTCLAKAKNFIERKDIGQIKPVLSRPFVNVPTCIYYFHITYISENPHKKGGHIHHFSQEISYFQLGTMSNDCQKTEMEIEAIGNETATTEEELRTATEALDDVHVDDDEESAEVVCMDLEDEEEPMKYVSLDPIPTKETKFRLTLIINSPLLELLINTTLRFILTQLSTVTNRTKSVPNSVALTIRRISQFCAFLNLPL